MEAAYVHPGLGTGAAVEGLLRVDGQLQLRRFYARNVREVSPLTWKAELCKSLLIPVERLGELRSGSTDSQGTVSSNKASLLYIISEDLKTSTESVMGAMATSVKNLKEIVEAGVNPEKSLKRKFEEHQEQQRVEDQKKEAERLQKAQEDQERQQLVMMIHPYTGQQMYLTGEQKDQFIRDLSTMKHTDFVSNVPVGTGSMGAGTPPIPSRGFPPGPPMGMGYGAMGTPATTFDSQSSRICSILCCSG